MPRRPTTQHNQPPEVAQPAPRPSMESRPPAIPPASLAGQHVDPGLVQEHQRYHEGIAAQTAKHASDAEGGHPSSDEPQRLAMEHNERWGQSPTAPAITTYETPEHPSQFHPTLPQGHYANEELHRPVGHIVHLAPPASSSGNTRTLSGGRMEIAAPAPTPSPADPDLTQWLHDDIRHFTGNEHMAADQEAPDRLGEPDNQQYQPAATGEQESGEYTVGELVDYMEDVNDPAELDRLEQAEEEREGGSRRRALAAIHERRRELSTPTDGGPEPAGQDDTSGEAKQEQQ